jgi:hypothetical protein
MWIYIHFICNSLRVDVNPSPRTWGLVLEFQIEEAVAPRTARLAIFEEHKSMPWAAVWEHNCASQGVAEGIGWLEKVRSYEKDTLLQRGGAQ